jgi:hypothetical protein
MQYKSLNSTRKTSLPDLFRPPIYVKILYQISSFKRRLENFSPLKKRLTNIHNLSFNKSTLN